MVRRVCPGCGAERYRADTFATWICDVCGAEIPVPEPMLLIIAGAVNGLDLDLEGFISRINHAEAVAPLFDPTAYMKAANNLSAIKRLAQALVPFVKEVREQAGVK